MDIYTEEIKHKKSVIPSEYAKVYRSESAEFRFTNDIIIFINFSEALHLRKL